MRAAIPYSPMSIPTLFSSRIFTRCHLSVLGSISILSVYHSSTMFDAYIFSVHVSLPCLLPYLYPRVCSQ